jgi:hypothetical protein
MSSQVTEKLPIKRTQSLRPGAENAISNFFEFFLEKQFIEPNKKRKNTSSRKLFPSEKRIAISC